MLQGCSFNIGTLANNPQANVNNAPANVAKPAESPAAQKKEPEKSTSDTKCEGFKLPGKVFIAKQSFPFDHKPFQGSCFVTFANKDDMVDAKDVPRGSTFHIYTNGKDAFEFPDAFAGQPACWVEAVAFDDLNSDGLTDVIMAGKCLAAKDSYPSNAIFVNDGHGFTTDDEANGKLQDLKSIDQIKSYVKKNLKEFYD